MAVEDLSARRAYRKLALLLAHRPARERVVLTNLEIPKAASHAAEPKGPDGADKEQPNESASKKKAN